MNALLNTTAGHVPARLLAQMRLAATKAKIAKPVWAEAFSEAAATRGLSAKMAEAGAKGVAWMADMAATRSLDDATTLKLVDDFLSELTGGTLDPADAPASPTAIAGKVLLSYQVATDVDHINTERPYTASVGTSWDDPRALNAKIVDARAAAIALRMGIKFEATMGREIGPDSLSHARAWARGQGLRMASDADTMQAFVTGRLNGPMMAGNHTTSDFPTISGSVVQLLVGRALEQAPVGLAKCINKIPTSDWRARKLANTSAASALTLLPEGDDPTFKTIDEAGESIPAPGRFVGAFQATDELLRNAISGGMDLEQAITRSLLASAQEAQRTVLAGAISANANMADGNAVFSAAHANINATAVAITLATVNTARTAMQRFVDTRGAARPVTPAILLVPPEKQTEAEQLVTVIMATKLGDVNPFSAGLQVIVDPGLPGTSTFYWYILPDPTQTDGLALILLDNMITPMVETRDAWPAFGMQWRCQWPLAAAFMRSSWFRTLGA